jgi:hypothetical protein
VLGGGIYRGEFGACAIEEVDPSVLGDRVYRGEFGACGIEEVDPVLWCDAVLRREETLVLRCDTELWYEAALWRDSLLLDESSLLDETLLPVRGISDLFLTNHRSGTDDRRPSLGSWAAIANASGRRPNSTTYHLVRCSFLGHLGLCCRRIRLDGGMGGLKVFSFSSTINCEYLIQIKF